MLKVGILGGGQLGRMLLQAAANYNVETFILENDPNCPSAHLCKHFVLGDIRDFNDVYAFGKNLNAITIEIENVNVEALEKLEEEGVNVIPKPAVLRLIKNKILQKEYYKNQNLPTADYVVTNSLTDVKNNRNFLPAVHKVAEGGYDGKGVVILQTEADFDKAFIAPAVLEKQIIIQKEIAVIVAIDKSGKPAIYPPVEMMFNKQLNLLDYQLSPASIPEKTLWKAEAIAIAVVRNFQSPGVFAVELFVDDRGEVLINETAPRVHNSGHHTIEAHYSSQFDMLWRIILGHPLGNTKAILSSIMVNVIGAEGYTGAAKYEGLNEVLKIDNAFVHLYGKAQTKPGRKMGHVTIISNEKQDLIHKANKVKQALTVKS